MKLHSLALGVVGLLSTAGLFAELLFPLDPTWTSMFLTSVAMALAFAATSLIVGCLGRRHLAVWAVCASHATMAVMGATVTVLRLMDTNSSVAALSANVALAAGTVFLFVYTYRVATVALRPRR